MAQTPIFLHELVSARYSIGSTAIPFDGTAVSQDDGTITYQWQKSSDGTNWEDISGQTSAYYTPSTQEVGSLYYRVKATNTLGGLFPSNYLYPAESLFPSDIDAAENYSNAAIVVVSYNEIVFVTQPVGMTYLLNEVPKALFALALSKNGNVEYQWQKSSDGTNWEDISEAISKNYLPRTDQQETIYYRVKAYLGTGQTQVYGYSETATVSISTYEELVRKPFIKVARLRFLQPDGSTAFALDNNARNERSNAFIAEGDINANLQNGTRRTANITLDNADSEFDYNVNKVWFGSQIALDEGFILPSGKPYYIQQAVFVVQKPSETHTAAQNTAEFDLTDKWANLDGTLGGNLEGTYEVEIGTYLFSPIASLLTEDKGNGLQIDAVQPIFTEYYNGKTQTLPDGSTAPLTDTPYTLRIDNDNGTVGTVIGGLCEMVNAWYGYDQNGALRIEPSQDDILDSGKPVQWRFSMNEVELSEADYESRPTEVYNDYIVLGEILNGNPQPCGRATNYDPNSDTNVNLIGKKTFRVKKNGFGTVKQCQDYAEWKLKRSAALQKSVTITCSQLFHIVENQLVEIVRTDKPGLPIERYLVMGFSRPLSGNGQMSITAVSVTDFPIATISTWPN